jgi:hypothetical protein
MLFSWIKQLQCFFLRYVFESCGATLHFCKYDFILLLTGVIYLQRGHSYKNHLFFDIVFILFLKKINFYFVIVISIYLEKGLIIQLSILSFHHKFNITNIFIQDIFVFSSFFCISSNASSCNYFKASALMSGTSLG